jgi:DNA-binding Lrp family transcriptional regulator
VSIFTVSSIFTDIVNNPVEIDLGAKFERKALRVLRSIPGLKGTARRGRDLQSDAVVRYAGSEIPVAIECKVRVSSAAAHQIVHRARHLAMPTVVVADEMTGQAREILSEAGIGSVDGLGNVRLELPGLLMRITGTGRLHRSAAPARLSGKSGLIAQAMLLEVDRSWRVSELARHCGVSPGLAHRVLRRLEDEGVAAARGAGPNKTRRLMDPAALLDLWTEEQRDRPSRYPAFMLAQTTDQLISSLCDGLEASAVDYALTGAAAATLVAPFLSNVLVAEVWLSIVADPSEVCAKFQATQVESGPNVVFLQERDDAPLAFRTRNDRVWTTNVFRLYADLRHDPRRGREQSEHLRREAIGF